MTSNELKYEAKKQKWTVRIQDCRSSGLFRRTAVGNVNCDAAYRRRQLERLPRLRRRAAENAGGADAPMLNDFTGADRIYVACGYTDLRKGIDGLARLVLRTAAGPHQGAVPGKGRLYSVV